MGVNGMRLVIRTNRVTQIMFQGPLRKAPRQLASS